MLGSVGVVSLLGIPGCGVDKQKELEDEADKLYKKKRFDEALELYEELDSTEEVEEKKSDCRFHLFIDYVAAKGGIEFADTGESGETITYSIKAFRNGRIVLVYRKQSHDEKVQPQTTYDFTIDIDRDEGTAELEGSYTDVDTSSGIVTQAGVASLDLEDYSYDKSVVWEITSDETLMLDGSIVPMGADMLTPVSGSQIEYMVRELAKAAEDSQTGCTIQDIGFTGLD